VLELQPFVSTPRPQTSNQLALNGTSVGDALSTEELSALCEALLLVATEPPTIEDLAEVAEVQPARIEAALSLLDEDESRGWIVQRHGDRLHLASAPRFARQIAVFLGLEREGKLSSAALETLAIIAYQQPVTRAEIDAVRGVDSSGVLATLHARELIEPVSRLAAVGNPFQYGTTPAFLKVFGLRSLADLPPLGQVNGEESLSLLEMATRAVRNEDAEPGTDDGE
jgi:segregation and condensation protein B